MSIKEKSIIDIKKMLGRDKKDIVRIYNIIEHFFVLKNLGSKRRYSDIFFDESGPGSWFDIEMRTIGVLLKHKKIDGMTAKEIILSVISEKDFDKAVETYSKLNPEKEEPDDYDDYDNESILGFDLEEDAITKPATAPEPIRGSMEDVDGGHRIKSRPKKQTKKSKKRDKRSTRTRNRIR